MTQGVLDLIEENPTAPAYSVERFEVHSGVIRRSVLRRSGAIYTSEVAEAAVESGPVDPDQAEAAYLRSVGRPDMRSSDGQELRCVDLFAGCGGITVGIAEACRSIGKGFHAALAVDFDAAALGVFETNFVGSRAETIDVTELFDGAFEERTTASEKALVRSVGRVDLLAGGPPCQGHSDLNNRTRRLDPKNELYFSMVRAAEILEPDSILIENVPGAIRDRRGVVQRTLEALVRLGYSVDFGVVDASKIGVAQKRKRLLVLASKSRQPNVASIEADFGRPARNIRWAIEDLMDRSTGELIDEPCESAAETRARIDYLFNNGLFDLPDEQRPPCHRNKSHSYSSIYGRLSWDGPAQTITTGFYSMCMGRYVHPTVRRTLTAHEAARLQYFPDHFDFSGVAKRGDLSRMIGNAVPTRLGYAAALELLR